MPKLRALLVCVCTLCSVLAFTGCGGGTAHRAASPYHVSTRLGASAGTGGGGTLFTPTNTSAPTISGTAAEGDTLTGAPGSWSFPETINSYTYVWQECREGKCTSIGGATASTYAVTEAQVGSTIKLEVTAHSTHGTGYFWSAETSTVTGAARSSECFDHEEACGFPGPNDTGVESGVTLTSTGNVVAKTENQVVEDKKIEGEVEIDANGVKLKNDELVYPTLQKICEEGTEASTAGEAELKIGHAVTPEFTGIVIEHVTIHGPNKACPELDAIGISRESESKAAENTKILYSKLYWCTLCVRGVVQAEHDLIETNGEQLGAHYDGFFISSGTLTVKHDTLKQPHKNTSNLSVLSNKGDIIGHVIVSENLIAGGGYVMYGGEKEEVVEGPVEVTNNRIARCTEKSTAGEGGGHYCEGQPLNNEPPVGYADQESDGHGYFPEGGYFGLWDVFNTGVTTASGNVWDNNNEAMPEP